MIDSDPHDLAIRPHDAVTAEEMGIVLIAEPPLFEDVLVVGAPHRLSAAKATTIPELGISAPRSRQAARLLS